MPHSLFWPSLSNVLCARVCLRLLGMPSTYQNMLTLKPSAHSENCHKLRYQVKENRDLCVLSHRALQTVSRGAKLGIDECQFQFRASRWNCTTFTNIPSVFGGVLNVSEYTAIP